MLEIRFTHCAHCYLCGKLGHLVHTHLEDKLFGASGAWNFRECSDKKCGLLWIDPMPLLEDLPKAYANYYTHGDKQQRVHSGRLRDLYREMKLAYLSSALGYKSKSVGHMGRWLSKILLFFPGRRTQIKAEVMFLAALSGGKLLDVGCGSGEWLERMQNLGWAVSGIDFDEQAVRIAKQKGLDVSWGTIPGTWFPTHTFDAITMNHVIEHVPDPVAVLRECERILKPGGKLVLATPNNSCWGRRLFKNYWRGLEPPRHLHIFSPSAMEEALRMADFRSMFVRTFDSSYIWRLSLMLTFNLTRRSTRDFRAVIAKLVAPILNFAEQIGLMFEPSAGECLLVVARKDNIPPKTESESMADH